MPLRQQEQTNKEMLVEKVQATSEWKRIEEMLHDFTKLEPIRLSLEVERLDLNSAVAAPCQLLVHIQKTSGLR